MNNVAADYLAQSLFLDLNAFFASFEQQENPALRGEPVIVVQTHTDSACAIAASYAAKAFGVKTGTLVRDARRLCPGSSRCRPITGSIPTITTEFSRPSILPADREGHVDR